MIICSLLFLAYLLCFVFTQQAKYRKHSIILTLCLFALYLQTLFQSPIEKSQGYFVMFFLGLLFAFSIRIFSFRKSILFCLFVIGARMMGLPPDGNFEEGLKIVVIGGFMILHALWGFYIANHTKEYQKYLLIILTFLVSYPTIWGISSFISSNDSFEIISRNPNITNLLIGCLALWGLYLIKKDCYAKKSFFLLAFFIFILMLYVHFNLLLGQLLFVFIALGFLIRFTFFEIIYQIGEYLLLFCFCLGYFIDKKTKTITHND